MPGLTDILGDKFLAVAHRGYPTAAPENTLASFTKALETGIGLIELDIQLSADHVPVVIHDPEVNRTTDGVGRVRDLGLGKINQLDAGSWFGPEFAGLRVPTLSEVLDWAKDKVGLVIELKNDVYEPEEMERAVDITLEAIDGAGMTGSAAVISFDHRAVARVESSGTGVIGGCLIMPRAFHLRERAGKLVRIADETGSRLILPFHRRINRRLVTRLGKEGLKILTWTADTETDILKQLSLGVSGMASNDPGLLVSTLKSAGVRF